MSRVELGWAHEVQPRGITYVQCNDLDSRTQDELRQCVRKFVNDERAAKGNSPLELLNKLNWDAQDWADHCRDQGHIEHDPNLIEAVEEQFPGQWSLFGENVGVGPNFDGLMQAFHNSPDHYSNMVKARYDGIGLGVIWNAGLLWVVMRFIDRTNA